jgi:hypothetical protein
MRRLLPFTLGLALWLSAGASPALEVVVDDVTVTSDAVDAVNLEIDVWLRVALGETLLDAGGWQAAVDLLGPAGVEIASPFALASPPNPHPPLIDENFLADFDSASGPLRASATAFLSSGAAPITGGAGLFRIPIRVLPLADGVYTFRVDVSPIVGSRIVDAQAQSIPFTTADGTLVVTRPARVPGLGRAGILVVVGLTLALGAWSLPRRASSSS